MIKDNDGLTAIPEFGVEQFVRTNEKLWVVDLIPLTLNLLKFNRLSDLFDHLGETQKGPR